MLSDPIADMLTRIRNASMVYHEEVEIPHSRFKEAIARVLYEEGYIRGYEVDRSGKFPVLRVRLKYREDGEPAIHEIKRLSKPGRRVYARADQVRPIKRGLGTAILSTSQGVLPDRECRRRRIGGEVICIVW